MKTNYLYAVIPLALLLASPAVAQPPGGRGGGNFMAAFPVYKALDADGNGEISAEEIQNSITALKSLDKNEDGVLTIDEIGPGAAGGRGTGGRPSGDGQAQGQRRGQGGSGGGRPGGEGQGRGMGRGMGGPPNPDAIFEGRDKNGDGKIEKSEAAERMQERWDDIDSNGDGFLDKEEQQVVIERLRERFGGGGQGRPNRRGQGGAQRGAGAIGRPSAPDDKDQLGGVAPRRPGTKSPQKKATTESEKPSSKNPVDRLMTLDTNNDGKLAKDELAQRFHSLITRADTNGDGVASREEVSTI